MGDFKAIPHNSKCRYGERGKRRDGDERQRQPQGTAAGSALLPCFGKQQPEQEVHDREEQRKAQQPGDAAAISGRPTPAGVDAGLRSEDRVSARGTPYSVLQFTPPAQKLIVEHYIKK